MSTHNPSVLHHVGRIFAISAVVAALPVTAALHTGTMSVHRHVKATSEYPFGQLAVAPNGTLYYVDRESEQIDEITKHGSVILLSSLNGTAAKSGSIAGIRGLSVTKDAIWFTADGNLYESSLNGHGVHRVGSAPDARLLDVLGDRTIYFATVTSVFERTPRGATTHVAGGTTIDFAEQQHGSQPAIDESINPTGIVGVSGNAFYFTNENNLYFVGHGRSTMLRPRQNFFNGELARNQSGFYGICNWSICRISGTKFESLFKLPHVHGSFAAPDALAVSPSGNLYISYSNQGTPLRAGIAEISAQGKLVAVVVSQTNQ